MNQLVEKMKSHVENPSRDEGIQGLLKLQAEVPENIKYKCRIACLHLMEMNHDWENIRKLVVEWRLVRNFGKELVTRMRQRVKEDPGFKLDDQQAILKQLDRLNDKIWRQFSPKKTFPKYSHLPQTHTNETNSKILVNIEEQKKKRKMAVLDQKPESAQILPISNANSIFSKISSLKNKQILNRTNSGNATLIGGQIKKETSKQKLPINVEKALIETKHIIDKNYQNTVLPADNKKSQPALKISMPTEIPKKIVSLKYGGQRDKQKNKEDSKDEFSFSAVKAQQIQGFSNRKMTKNDDLDNSFLNFTHDSRLPRDHQENLHSIKKGNILENSQLQQNFHAQSSRHRRSRPLYSEQQLNLIQPGIPPKNRLETIFLAEGIGALDMLRKRLNVV